jgi:hypothetical protein
MKSGPRRVFRYSSRYEKTLPNGPFRCRRELHRTSHAASFRTWPTADPQPPRDTRRELLYLEKRLPVASTPARLFRSLKAKVHSAKVMYWDGIKTLLQRADEHFPRLKHLWVDAGYRGEDKSKDWVQKTLGWSVDLVERPSKPAPKEVLMACAEQWLHEGVVVDWGKLMPPKGFVVLPREGGWWNALSPGSATTGG